MKRLFLAIAFAAVSTAASAADVSAGRYQSVLGDCEGCHGKNLAGGVELMTPFGKLVEIEAGESLDGGWDHFLPALKAP